MRSLASGFENQGSAASQGTTANIAEQAPNLVSSKTFQNDAGEIQYKDPATGELVPTDQNKQVALRNPDDQSVSVYNRTPDTDEGRLSALGHLVQTGMGPGSLARPVTIAGPAAARETAIASGNRIGVDIPSAIVSTSPIVRLGGQVAARAPGGGPFQNAVTNSLKQLGEARGRAVEMAGGSTDPAAAGGAVRQGIKGEFLPAQEERLNQAYSEVGKLVDPNVKTPLASTQKTVANILARRQASGASSEGKAVEHVKEAVLRPDGLTFAGLKDLRTRLGYILRGTAQEGLDKGELKQIYEALATDLEASARHAGGEQAAKMAERASALTKAIKGWEEGLKKVLGNKMRSDESVTETILRAASKEGGDLNTLALARKAVPPEAWKDIASTAISRLGRNNKGEFSPAIYLNDYANLSDRGKSLLFGSVGKRDLIPFLDDIAGVSKAFHEAGKMGNPSGSAGHADLLLTLQAAFLAAASGSFKVAAGIASGPAVNNLMARALATKATAASMARWARAWDAVKSNPTPNALAVFNITSRNMAHTVNGTLGTNISPADLTKAAR